MVRPIKVIQAVDKVLDCVPLVSTAKNIGIRLYQKTHKANEAAAKTLPMDVSWKDDLKIHMLTKETHVWSFIPIVDDVCNFIKHIVDSFRKKSPQGYLSRIVTGNKGHLSGLNQSEALHLYYARNQDREGVKFTKPLRAAAALRDNESTFLKNLLYFRVWETDVLLDAVEHSTTFKSTKLIIDRAQELHLPSKADDEKAKTAIHSLAQKGSTENENVQSINYILGKYSYLDFEKDNFRSSLMATLMQGNKFKAQADSVDAKAFVEVVVKLYSNNLEKFVEFAPKLIAGTHLTDVLVKMRAEIENEEEFTNVVARVTDSISQMPQDHSEEIIDFVKPLNLSFTVDQITAPIGMAINRRSQDLLDFYVSRIANPADAKDLLQKLLEQYNPAASEPRGMIRKALAKLSPPNR